METKFSIFKFFAINVDLFIFELDKNNKERGFFFKLFISQLFSGHCYHFEDVNLKYTINI